MFFDFLNTFDVIVHKFPCFKQTHWALGFNYLHFTTKESSFVGETCHITEQVCHTNYCQSPFHYIFNAPTRIQYITFLSQPLRTFVLPFLWLHNNSNTTVGAGVCETTHHWTWPIVWCTEPRPHFSHFILRNDNAINFWRLGYVCHIRYGTSDNWNLMQSNSTLHNPLGKKVLIKSSFNSQLDELYEVNICNSWLDDLYKANV